jgi:hypothetical protein
MAFVVLIRGHIKLFIICRIGILRPHADTGLWAHEIIAVIKIILFKTLIAVFTHIRHEILRLPNLLLLFLLAFDSQKLCSLM